MSPLDGLIKSGFNVSLNNDNNIEIIPASKLTQEQRAIIKENKSNIVNELKPYLHWHVVTKNDNGKMSVIPKTTIAAMRIKFPHAILIEPIETIQ